jgi:hypothetical protein
MNTKISLILTATVAVGILNGCGGDGIIKSAEYKEYIKGNPVMLEVGDVICLYGGTRYDMGIDWNENEQLDDYEIISHLSTYECNGEDGENGTFTYCGCDLCSLDVYDGDDGTDTGNDGDSADDGSVDSGSGDGDSGTDTGNDGGSADDGETTVKYLTFSGRTPHFCDGLCGPQYEHSYSLLSAAGKQIKMELWIDTTFDGIYNPYLHGTSTVTWSNGCFTGGDPTLHNGKHESLTTSNCAVNYAGDTIKIDTRGNITTGGNASYTSTQICFNPNGIKGCLNYTIQ